tara:strand:- start:33 stop:440 length:408 start_codon:yes stop_codon:yes gene_type:complete
MTTNFENVSNHIEECIINLSVDVLNPAKLFTLSIQTIEYLDNEYQDLSGEQKRDLLIEAFTDLCDNTKHESLTPEIKKNIREFINNDLDTVIESVIQLSKGDFKINQKQQKMIIRCLLQLCQCIMKKQNETNKRP